MLNVEYARLVDQERRRIADARIEIERVLQEASEVHAPDDLDPARPGRHARAPTACRGVPGPAR